MSAHSRLVYSTEHETGRPDGQDNTCRHDQHAKSPSVSGPVRVSRETKGRKGAGVTVVTGLPFSEAEQIRLLKLWKKRLGCGGTSRDGRLEFQGEHRDTLCALLKEAGIHAKKAGG